MIVKPKAVIEAQDHSLTLEKKEVFSHNTHHDESDSDAHVVNPAQIKAAQKAAAKTASIHLDAWSKKNGWGSLARVARKTGVLQQTVYQWKKGIAQIPIQYCAAVEQVTGIPCEILREDQKELFEYLRHRIPLPSDVCIKQLAEQHGKSEQEYLKKIIMQDYGRLQQVKLAEIQREIRKKERKPWVGAISI